THVYRTELRDSPKIVPGEIDQHAMLGLLLCVQLELRPHLGVARRIAGLLASAGDGASSQERAAIALWPLFDQQLGRSTHQLPVAEIGEAHPGRRIERSETEVRFPG